MHRTIPISVIISIFKWFILDCLNASNIQNKIKNKYWKNITLITISKILLNIRKSVAEYTKDKYMGNKIGGGTSESDSRICAIDESLFTHVEGQQTWVVGVIDTKNKAKRFDVINERNSENLKVFITNNLLPGTHITHNNWPAYNFLNDINLGYTHEFHSHGGGDFGYGAYSTAHIEGIWGQLKGLLKKMYNSIPQRHFIYFLREAEFRINIII